MTFAWKTQKAVAPYRLIMARNNRRYLMHGQSTQGKNNGVPVRSVAHAKEIAADWRKAGIPAPYDCLSD